MYRYIITLVSVFVGSLAYSQAPILIKGVFTQEWKQTIRLFKVDDGNMKEMAQSQPQTDNKFGFVFYPEYEGFYAIGTGDASLPSGNFIFYLKAGDNLEIELSNEGYKLVGQSNSPESSVLYAWYQKVQSLEQRSLQWKNFKSTYTSFFPDVERIEAETSPFVQQHKTSNLKFDQLLPTYLKWNLAACASTYINIPHSVHPTLADYPAYYQTVRLSEFSNSAKAVYDMPWGNRTLAMISMLQYRSDKIAHKKGVEGLDMELTFIQNDTLKGDAVLNYLARQKDYNDYKAAADKYRDLFLTDRQQLRANQIMNDMAQLKPGDTAFDFSFPDVKGNIVRLSDLKGKVVLVDVWATWCGPCKQQIPYLKQLEEEMKDTDLQVVSISVDEAKDRQKWVDMIEKEELGGIQLFASGWGEFVKYYKITGIPRFMVFDRAGKIVSVNSPRPSDPKLKDMLQMTLHAK